MDQSLLFESVSDIDLESDGSGQCEKDNVSCPDDGKGQEMPWAAEARVPFEDAP